LILKRLYLLIYLKVINIDYNVAIHFKINQVPIKAKEEQGFINKRRRCKAAPNIKQRLFIGIYYYYLP
jgi:hypothetical protein